MLKSCLATLLRTVNFKKTASPDLFSLLSNIKADEDDSVEDTGNGTEEENTGSEEGEEKDVEDGEDEGVRKQISSFSVRG